MSNDVIFCVSHVSEFVAAESRYHGACEKKILCTSFKN